MEKHAEDARRKAMVIDIDMLVPKDHLLRKIEKVMDYDWLYERLNPLYNDKVGRPGTDPVVLIKMVLIQHLFGIPSLRQTWRECDVNVAYRWFLGYDLLEHFLAVRDGVDEADLPAARVGRHLTGAGRTAGRGMPRTAHPAGCHAGHLAAHDARLDLRRAIKHPRRVSV